MRRIRWSEEEERVGEEEEKEEYTYKMFPFLFGLDTTFRQTLTTNRRTTAEGIFRTLYFLFKGKKIQAYLPFL